MKASKAIFAVAAVTVYIVCPAYRYYVIGAWVGHKILRDQPRFTPVPKGSKVYNRIVRATIPACSEK